MASSIINSDDGSVSGTTGLKTTGGDDGELAFESSGTEAMRIDSSGNLILGGTTGYGRISIEDIPNSGTTDFFAAYRTGSVTNLLTLAYDQPNNAIDFESNSKDFVFKNGASGIERARISGGGAFYFNSGYGSSAIAYGCRAWVNFNGTSTVAIRASGNVSSITDNGTGDYTVNFTTAMPDANYSISGSAGGADNSSLGCVSLNSGAFLTSSIRAHTVYQNGLTFDYAVVNIAVFR